MVAFYGELGAGKTEFIKGICAGFRVEEIVSSPTFTVVNQYEGVSRKEKPVTIFHVDLYRINSVAELREVGFEELIEDQQGVKLVEWAEYAVALLPPNRYDIHFYSDDDADSNARDCAVAVSIALQHGAPAEVIRRALCRDGSGNPSGPVGAALDLLARERSPPGDG